MLPGTFAYVYLGSAGRAAGEAVAGGGGVSPMQAVLYGVGAVATVLATRAISRAANSALEEAGAVGSAAGLAPGGVQGGEEDDETKP